MSSYIQQLQLSAQSQTLRPQEAKLLLEYLNTRYPAEHATTANNGRLIDGEPDAAGWLQAAGLEQHELKDLLVNPP